MATVSALAPPDAKGAVAIVAVAGEGLLAEAVASALAPRSWAARDGVGEGSSMLVSATDCWDVAGHAGHRARARSRVVPWLPVRVELGTVVIGPLETPGELGCVDCAEMRRRRAREDPLGHDAVMATHREALATTPSSLLTGLAASTVSALVADEVEAVVAGALRPRTHRAILRVDLATLAVSRHRFLPEPLCPHCGDLPPDDAASARIRLTDQPKLAPGTHRVRPVLDELDELKATYVDAESGLIRTIIRGSQAGLVVAAALMRVRSHEERVEPGIGRTRSYRASELIGVLEALERYGGVEPGGKRTVTRGSYAQLADRALDPRTLGTHPDGSYQIDGFPYRPFTEDAVCKWVWGYSFGRQEPVLVPETAAYYHTARREPEDQPFFYEISNGCSLGSSLEEAILHGLLEVAERDAFLLTWYSRLAVPRIDLDSSYHPALPLQAAAIKAETGFDVEVFDTTMEHGVPSVWAIAVNRQREPANPDDRPAPEGVCAAGASLDLERAALNALSELGPIVYDLRRRFPDEVERGRRMVADPNLVVTMQDHSTLYAQPEAFARLDFLTGATSVRTLESAPDGRFRNRHLSDDLRVVLASFASAGMDVVVVDQTTPEHRAGGFACVKVLVPGALPMTFGHANRRVDGLPRLDRVPQLLGQRTEAVGRAEVNPHPHPFP